MKPPRASAQPCYSYGGPGCANCSAGATFVSSSAGCAPATAATDTAFYLSGSQAEGVAAFPNASAPAGVSFATGPFGAVNGSLVLSAGSYLGVPGALARP